ncbi:hypothetical protein BVC71_05605 [Marivivens niveibacter]|uniref:Tellurium resistance protein n=1 Tax=Marivivens niveibacter TaxID=1930667 RepID=A0A251X2J7_9RHOB|nr:TrgA family protein [Marivivens niveibacter]OUD10940.1 hypothetical protein BVC71_05605 [Marivivens niveibacter]
MPTFAKLAAAVVMAALMYVVTDMVLPMFDPSQPPRWFMQINIAYGAVFGWKIIGGRAGNGAVIAISTGISAIVVTIAAVLLTHGFDVMLERAYDMRYDGPVEALTGAVGLAIDLGAKLFTPIVGMTLIAGAIIASLVAEIVSRFAD